MILPLAIVTKHNCSLNSYSANQSLQLTTLNHTRFKPLEFPVSPLGHATLWPLLNNKSTQHHWAFPNKTTPPKTSPWNQSLTNLSWSTIDLQSELLKMPLGITNFMWSTWSCHLPSFPKLLELSSNVHAHSLAIVVSSLNRPTSKTIGSRMPLVGWELQWLSLPNFLAFVSKL